MNDMTPELRRQLLERLSIRSQRLAKVAGMEQAPPSVVALMAEHVTTTAMLLLGDAFAYRVFEKLLVCLRESNGICLCGHGQIVIGQGLCAACITQCEADDRADEAYLAMEAPTKGQPS